MSFLDRFKKQHDRQPERSTAALLAKSETKPKTPTESKSVVKTSAAKKADSSRNHKTMPGAFRLVSRPLITEKTAQLGALNKYVFEVPISANRQEVAKAIRSIYNVAPIQVNMLRVSGKSVRYGQSSGITKDWKKAIVTVAAGQTINVQDGV
ncbi:MAG: 50S ribosomal protein L23 [Patescibacteria group bacterium]|jgi:large subunit ribosomal protein L23